MEGEDHTTVLPKGLMAGLEFLYAECRLPADVAAQGSAAVTRYHDDLSNDYGFDITISEGAANDAAFQLIQQDNVEGAIGILKFGIEMHPESAGPSAGWRALPDSANQRERRAVPDPRDLRLDGTVAGNHIGPLSPDQETTRSIDLPLFGILKYVDPCILRQIPQEQRSRTMTIPTPASARASVTAVLIILAMATGPAIATAQTYYFNDFDGGEAFDTGISGGVSGAGVVESVQGYSVLSPAFDGDFLRSIAPGNPAPASTLTLTGLPANAPIEIRFSLAIIDSWDGSTFPPDPTQAPDYLNVRVNGNVEFSETFTNLSSIGATQSYPDTALALEIPLGFEAGIYRNDSAYELSVFSSADSAGTLVIDIFTSGSGWHAPSTAGPEEESWAVDNLTIQSALPTSVRSSSTPNFVLHQSYPNPSISSAQIPFELLAPARVDLAVFDVAGRLVTRLVYDEYRGAGHHEVGWNGRDQSGRSVASGVYYYRLSTPTHHLVRKLVLVR